MKTIIRLAHIPPSTNGLYRNVNGRGRVKTERYKVWLQAVSHDMKRYGKFGGAAKVADKDERNPAPE